MENKNKKSIKLYVGCDPHGCYYASKSKKTLMEYGYDLYVFEAFLQFIKNNKVYVTICTTFKDRKPQMFYTERNAYPTVGILRDKSRLWQDKLVEYGAEKSNTIMSIAINRGDIYERTKIIGVNVI